MVTVSGKLAREWIEAYKNIPGSHVDFLPLSKKYYGYGAGFVTINFEVGWDTCPVEDCFCEINEAESIV
ncbi:MAG: hypothetical protein ABFC78_06430 [Methanoregula sp.]